MSHQSENRGAKGAFRSLSQKQIENNFLKIMLKISHFSRELFHDTGRKNFFLMFCTGVFQYRCIR